MKRLIPYFLLLAWVGYTFAGIRGFASMAKTSPDKLACHKTGAKQEENRDCCSKFHKEAGAEKSPNSKNNAKDDCCGDSDCLRTCCNLAITIMQGQEDNGCFETKSVPDFQTLPADQLPDPYLGKLFPPPNA